MSIAKLIGFFVALAAAAMAASAAYAAFLRPRVLNWGAIDEEAVRLLPGDDILDEVALQTTRAVTINAPPAAIWPWLVQMGAKPRAGAYTYAWVERMLGIDIENSERILPEFQHLEPGQFLPVRNGDNGVVVRQVAENEALVFQWTPGESTWAFVLVPNSDGTTRLLSRNRIPGGSWKFWLGMFAFMEPGSLVMERKMLTGIRDRAERLAASAGPAAARALPDT